MSTLLERSAELKVGIDRIANQERDAQIAQNLAVIADVLKGFTLQAHSLAVNVRVLAADELLAGAWITAPEVTSLQRRTDALRKRVQENRSEARKGNIWANCETDAKSLARNVTNSVESAWSRYLETLHTDTSSFASFRNVPACHVVLRKVDEINNTIRGRMQALPTTRKEVTDLAALGKEAKELIRKLKLDGVPKGVETLLKNAALGGAPLSALTDDVLAWLRENPEYLQSLRITASPH
jgi:hypothetical protein